MCTVFSLILPKQFWAVEFSTCGPVGSQKLLNSGAFGFYIFELGMLCWYGQHEVQIRKFLSVALHCHLSWQAIHFHSSADQNEEECLPPSLSGWNL